VPPDLCSADAAVMVLTQLAQNFDHWLATLMREDEPAAIHKARVALRRFRVALYGFDPILHPDLADDLDVMAERSAELRSKAQSLREKTRKMLTKKKAAGFARLVQKRMAGKSWRKPGKKAKALAAMKAQTLAHGALNRAWADCLSNGTNLTAMSERAQHELRKDLKTLRYLSEFFAVLWPDAPLNAFLHDMRLLQEDLGLLNDRVIAAEHGLAAADDSHFEARRVTAAQAWTRVQQGGKWWEPIQADAEL
jgi:CHAD domain-containing protein